MKALDLDLTHDVQTIFLYITCIWDLRLDNFDHYLIESTF